MYSPPPPRLTLFLQTIFPWERGGKVQELYTLLRVSSIPNSISIVLVKLSHIVIRIENTEYIGSEIFSCKICKESFTWIYALDLHICLL